MPAESQPLAGQHRPSPFPSRSYPTPHHDDVLLVEPIDTSNSDYAALRPGEPYPDATKYPEHVFLQERAGKWPFATRIWGSPRLRQDDYNYAIQYSGDVNTVPVFVRSYFIRRTEYARTGPAAKLSTLPGLYGLDLTEGGTGYEPNISFELIFTGGTGSGATGVAVTDSDGAVAAVYLTAFGSYTVVPNVVFTNGGPGYGAAATALRQPTTAILTHEEMQELGPDDPMHTVFVRVVRVYEVLPGPTLIDAEIDEAFGFPVRYTTEKTVIQTPTTPASSQTVSGGIISVTEIKATANKYKSIQVVAKIDTSVLSGSFLGTPFAQVYYASRNYNWPAEVNGAHIAPLTLLAANAVFVSVQRHAGYSGPTDCFVGRKFTLPTVANTPANPSRMFVPVKWFTDEVSTQTTGGDGGVASPVVVSSLLNNALHAEILFGYLQFWSGAGQAGSIVTSTPFLGTVADIQAVLDNFESVYGFAIGSYKFTGPIYPATIPLTSKYTDVIAAFPAVAGLGAAALDFGATFRTAMGLPSGDEKMVCIGVDNHPWRFGIMVQDFWFATPVRNDTRDFGDGTVTGNDAT